MKSRKVISFDSSVVKDYNEKLGLLLIREHGVISSSELVKTTGLRPSTIFNILKELSAKSLIKFLGKGEATDKGGKRPYLWSLNGDAAYVIGLDVEIGEIRTVIQNLSGEIVDKKTVKVCVANTVDELVHCIVTVVNEAIETSGIPVEKFLGLGLAFTGIIDCEQGVVVMSGILPVMNFPIIERLQDKFPFPVIIENNANAAAIGEKWIGQGKDKRDFLALLIELDKNIAGLGIGIILEGELYHGVAFGAGELYPHLPTLRDMLLPLKMKLSEGKHLKNYVSCLDQLDIYKMLEFAKDGDQIALHLFSHVGKIIGQTISPTIAVLNPDTLIITGVLAELGELIIEPIKRAIEMEVLSITSASLQIIASDTHLYSVSIGAASLVLYNFFRLPTNTN